MLQTNHSTHPSTVTPVLTLRCKSHRSVGGCDQKSASKALPRTDEGIQCHQVRLHIRRLHASGSSPISNIVADLTAHEYAARHLPQLRSQTAKLTLSHMHWQWCCSLKIGRGSGASGSQSCPGFFREKVSHCLTSSDANCKPSEKEGAKTPQASLVTTAFNASRHCLLAWYVANRVFRLILG